MAATAAIIGGDTNHAIDILEANAQFARRPGDPQRPCRRLRPRRSQQFTDDASRALTAANRALEIDRLMPEALFNRALALQTVGKTDDARIAWQAYLTIDDRSGWADEARARLRILSNQP